jgi:hypothetical protein
MIHVIVYYMIEVLQVKIIGLLRPSALACIWMMRLPVNTPIIYLPMPHADINM